MEHKSKNNMELKIKNISVNIQDRNILQDISLLASPRQFIGLLGANGSGKSTLLKTIYRVLKPISGTIYLNEREVLTSPLQQLAKELAVVGQFNHTDFDFSVLDFVLMGRYPHKKKFEKMNQRDKEIAFLSLDKMGMKAYASRSISTLSGGEKQRIIVARALAQEPKCLILDEPTNHLDIKHQLQLFSILKEMQITTIAAIHDIAFAYNFCDKIYALKNGQIASFGTPQEVITPKIIKQVYDVDIEILYSEDKEEIAICYPLK